MPKTRRIKDTGRDWGIGFVNPAFKEQDKVFLEKLEKIKKTSFERKGKPVAPTLQKPKKKRKPKIKQINPDGLVSVGKGFPIPRKRY